jgi:uncharacterized protein (DUF433 family)
MVNHAGKSTTREVSEDMAKKKRKLLGRYIVADPAICHGKPTFIGTRVMVWQVLKQVARGMPWDEITREWSGTVCKEAIAEALEIAHVAFRDHPTEIVHMPKSA